MGTVYLGQGEAISGSPFVQVYRSVRMILDLLMDLPWQIWVILVLTLGMWIGFRSR